jgi:putative transcriptional regulator
MFAVAVPARESRSQSTGVYLAGQLLVASPRIQDPRFQKTVIYMIAHDASGAFGLIVNRATGRASIKSFLKGFGLEAGAVGGDLVVHYGGPVETGLGYVLHTTDYEDPFSRKVAGKFAWSPAPAAIEAVTYGIGPKHYLFTLGYSGWGPNQLEGELARGDWLIAPADESLVFELKGDEAWDKAREAAGVRL